MGLEIFKKGQGSVARLSAYGLLGLLVLFGAYRLHATFNVPGEGVLVQDLPVVGSLTILKLISVAVFLLAMLGLHLVLNKPASANLLIDSEQEMRKVSWPSWPEVKSATFVVVVVTFVMGMALYGFDEILLVLFSLIF